MFVAHSALTPVWLMRNIQIWSETNSTAGPYPEQHLTLLISLLMHSDAQCVHCTLDKPSEHISESQCIRCRASLHLVSGKMQKRSLMEAYHCNASTVHLNSAPPLAASALAVKSKYFRAFHCTAGDWRNSLRVITSAISFLIIVMISQWWWWCRLRLRWTM